MDSNALVTSRRKRNTPKRFQRITEQCSGARICDNSACRAVLSVSKKFCTRCSCCICKEYDDNKDPSLWLECTPDFPVRSCGLSCHIKCALESGKVGVVNICQMTRLDCGYWCSYCGHISGILGCLKKQLTLAKDSRRVAILCHRIDLSFKMLDGTSRLQDLFEIVKAAKSVLESEVGSLGGSKMARGLVSRLRVAAEVQALCTAAVQKADELSATRSIASLEGEDPDLSMLQMVVYDPSIAGRSQSTPHGLDLDMVTVPEPNEDVAPVNDSSMDNAVLSRGGLLHGLDLNMAIDPEPNVVVAHDSSMDNTDLVRGVSKNCAQQAPNEELPDVNVQAEVARGRPARAEAHGDLNENFEQGPDEEMPAVSFQAEVARVAPAATESHDDLDVNYEYCLEVIQGLVRDNHFTSEVREKLFTWFSLRSDEHQRRVVYTFIQVFEEDSRGLAEQLADAFGDVI